MDPATPFRRLVEVSELRDFVTPIEDVYVIAHLGIARVDASEWRLRVDGLVDRELVLSLAELRALPAREIVAAIECFGNPLEPDAPTRRAANVVWRGTPLAGLLARADARPEATCVWLEGLDTGAFADKPVDRYRKDLPLERVIEGDVLVAYEMNGAPLTHEHGFPARIYVPGYFGTSSVKWLSRITLADRRPEGLFTTELYTREVGGERVPVREMDVNSIVVEPAVGAHLALGRHPIRGWAWSAWPIERVEVSVDDGAWHDARLDEPQSVSAWRRFELEWTPARRGPHVVRCRATDRAGRSQSSEGRNAVHEVTVAVE
jgi:sulfane dehydrogenase subunit SoxC